MAQTNEITEEVVHINGYPKRLVIFLHGYIDSAPSLEKRIYALIERLDNTAFHLPQAPVLCEIHEAKRQWYSMHRFDPDDERKTAPTMADYVKIYNRMRPGIEEAAYLLNNYIENCVQQYQIPYENIYICGFSQGATLAMYLSLMTEQKIGGCVEFSGILAPDDFLRKHFVSAPDFLLIHGTADNMVRFEALDFTQKELQKIGCKTETLAIENANHRITPEGIAAAIKFISKR